MSIQPFHQFEFDNNIQLVVDKLNLVLAELADAKARIKTLEDK